MEPDFSGYATKAGLKCSDGRTIMKDAFAHQDKMQVPLVWSHAHDDVENVLGHAVLENRADGVYAHGYFNSTPKGQAAKAMVQHKDLTSLSIYANGLVERSKQVLHGAIREVSLVLAGANPGALIDFIAVAHGDGTETVFDDQAIITTGQEIELEHADTSSSSDNGETVQDVYDTFTDQQKEVVHYMIGAALEASDGAAAQHSDDGSDNSEDTESEDESDDSTDVSESEDTTEDTESEGTAEDTASEDNSEDNSSDDTTTEGDLNHQEGSDMNVFEQNGTGTKVARPTLSHSQIETIVSDAKKPGVTLKDSFLAHADEYGITDINMLFPDAKAVTTTPQMLARRTEWVAKVLDGTKHSPFAKVKSLLADVTAEEARAKGYVKGNRKVEEVIKLLRRTTGPTTVYKKQKLDRDDIIDITDFDVVNWLWAEINMMLQEELARAILVGDGRSSLSDDKIKDPEGAVDGTGIRSVLHDDDLYSVKVQLAANVAPKDAVKGLVRARSKYRGTGKPTLFISDGYLTDIMLEEDKFGRALYETEQALVDKLRVSEIVTVDLFDDTEDLFAIMVSLSDYTIGTNAGGELTRFDDFDIDFNQFKYLLETRLSGGLTKPYSAVVVRRAVGALATPTAPSFDGATDTITIPTAEGVNYLVDDEVVTGDVVITGPTEVVAEPADGYYLASNSTHSWTYNV